MLKRLSPVKSQEKPVASKFENNTIFGTCILYFSFHSTLMHLFTFFLHVYIFVYVWPFSIGLCTPHTQPYRPKTSSTYPIAYPLIQIQRYVEIILLSSFSGLLQIKGCVAWVCGSCLGTDASQRRDGSQRRLPCDAVVNAAGAWMANLSELLGRGWWTMYTVYFIRDMIYDIPDTNFCIVYIV